MEGVGTGALAAAGVHKNFDLDALIADTPWSEGEAVPYAFLAATFNNIAPETKRLAIVAMLTGAFRAIIARTPEDLLPAVYLCVSRVRAYLNR
jgi:DNA ligase 1